MEQYEIESILSQINEGKNNRGFVYSCCGETFPSIYEFRKHLYESHPVELSDYFESALHRDPVEKPTKEEIHRMANKGKKKVEKEKIKKENRLRARKRDSSPTPNKGDHFHLIYTPMGNKK